MKRVFAMLLPALLGACQTFQALPEGEQKIALCIRDALAASSHAKDVEAGTDGMLVKAHPMVTFVLVGSKDARRYHRIEITGVQTADGAYDYTSSMSPDDAEVVRAILAASCKVNEVYDIIQAGHQSG